MRRQQDGRRRWGKGLEQAPEGETDPRRSGSRIPGEVCQALEPARSSSSRLAVDRCGAGGSGPLPVSPPRSREPGGGRSGHSQPLASAPAFAGRLGVPLASEALPAAGRLAGPSPVRGAGGRSPASTARSRAPAARSFPASAAARHRRSAPRPQSNRPVETENPGVFGTCYGANPGKQIRNSLLYCSRARSGQSLGATGSPSSSVFPISQTNTPPCCWRAR